MHNTVPQINVTTWTRYKTEIQYDDNVQPPKKRKSSSTISSSSPLGRDVEVLYDDHIWYRGKITSFNVKVGKWNVLFYEDNETTDVTFLDEKVRFV